MKLLFIKRFEYWNSKKNKFSVFERMKVYNLPKEWSIPLINDKIAIEYLSYDDLSGVNR